MSGGPVWHTDEYPELRSAPPWVTDEMIAAQPGVAVAVPDALGPAVESVATSVREVIAGGHAVTVVGCGTSEHAAEGVAACLRAAVPVDARARICAQPALTAALAPVPGLCIAVSHDGGTRATAHALDAAHGAGARTVAVTARRGSEITEHADIVLLTPRRDLSWCHTVAYTSALVAGAQIAGAVGGDPESRAGTGARAAELLDEAIAAVRSALASPEGTALAEALARARVVLCAGAGTDRTTARELALKVAEGARLATAAFELETVVHGQLAGHDASDALVVVALDGDLSGLVAARIGHVAAAARALGMSVAGVVSPAIAEALAPEATGAGRLVLPDSTAVPAPLGPLLAGAAALQLLTLALARVRDVNPDLIRREQEPYRRAAAAAEDSAW